jgi:hypothetical protein
MDSVASKIVIVTTSVDKHDINGKLIPKGTMVKGEKRDDYAEIYEVETIEDNPNDAPSRFPVLTANEYNPDSFTILKELPEQPRSSHLIYEDNPEICIIITKPGLVTHGMPHTPIPVGTKLRGKLNHLGFVENARSEDGTLFKKILIPSQYREDKSCSISGGRSKRKRVKKTKRRRSRAKK